MSAPHAPAPDIDGYTLVRHLGSGGYSDVYLYEQHSPRMPVAIKVLPSGALDGAERAQFESEAQTMAQLSGHPHIVQVFRSGTADDGRPYLVMTYYPPPNLGERVAQTRLSIAEAIRIGIKISAAVELAHRAGILHRDIKPANILVNEYGEPGLADFGIAGRGDAEGSEDIGVSTPWCAPEVVNGLSNGTFQSDVYSLAATVWNLLVGRSPFEIANGDNERNAITGRVLRGGSPSTGRADVPASLERLLHQAMARNPALRPATALDFAQSLQGIELEMRLDRTKIPGAPSAAQIPAASSGRSAAGRAPVKATPRAGNPTEYRPLVVPPAPPADGARRRPVDSDAGPRSSAAVAAPSTIRRPEVAGRTRVSGSSTEQLVSTTQRPAAPEPAPEPELGRSGPGRRTLVIVGVCSLLVIVAVGIWLLSSGPKRPGRPTAPPTALATDQTAGIGLPPAAPVVRASSNRTRKAVTFSWTVPDGSALSFGWYPGTDSSKLTRTSSSSVTLPSTDPAHTCISVIAIPADGGAPSDPSQLSCG